jgi:hypothetical protein
VTADSAYTMWGLAQPGFEKTGPTKWLQEDCGKALILTLGQIRTILATLRGNTSISPDYCAYWISYYETALQRREETI